MYIFFASLSEKIYQKRSYYEKCPRTGKISLKFSILKVIHPFFPIAMSSNFIKKARNKNETIETGNKNCSSYGISYKNDMQV